MWRLRLEGYIKKTYGSITDDVKKRIQKISDEWDVEIVNGMVDLTKFYNLLYEYLEKDYMGIASLISCYSDGYSPDVIYVDMSSDLMSGESLESDAKSVQSSFKEVKGVIDLVKENLKNASNYKDSNRVRSYIHLMYLEDPEYAKKTYGSLFSVSAAGGGTLDPNDPWYSSSNGSDFISFLKRATNTEVTGWIKYYDKDQAKLEILLYKQLLFSTLNYASKKILNF